MRRRTHQQSADCGDECDRCKTWQQRDPREQVERKRNGNERATEVDGNHLVAEHRQTIAEPPEVRERQVRVGRAAAANGDIDHAAGERAGKQCERPRCRETEPGQ